MFRDVTQKILVRYASQGRDSSSDLSISNFIINIDVEDMLLKNSGDLCVKEVEVHFDSRVSVDLMETVTINKLKRLKFVMASLGSSSGNFCLTLMYFI